MTLKFKGDNSLVEKKRDSNSNKSQKVFIHIGTKITFKKKRYTRPSNKALASLANHFIGENVYIFKRKIKLHVRLIEVQRRLQPNVDRVHMFNLEIMWCVWVMILF